MVEIVAVLDVRNGQTVHAAGGERRAYRRLKSVLTGSSRPLDVARAIRDALGVGRVYVADLDALESSVEPSYPLFEELAGDGFRVLADAAVRDETRARALIECGVDEVAVASETLPEPRAVARVLSAIGPERTVFSLDLQAGRLFRGPPQWERVAPIEAVRDVLQLGVRRLLLLDLAAVGRDAGWSLGDLVERILEVSSPPELLTGGGVRGVADLDHLASHRIAAALVASALHSGALRRADVERWRSRSAREPLRGPSIGRSPADRRTEARL